MASRWWISGPRLAARVSRGLAFSLADGLFLVAAPQVARWAPPALALLGFTAGALTLGYERVFSEALWLVVAAALAGALATGLGACLVGGFAAGDFALGQQGWALGSRAPLPIGYALLAALAVLLPRLARTLIADVPGARRLPRAVAFAILTVLDVIVLSVAVRLWAESSAVLVRPLFTWQGGTPSVTAASVLQEHAAWVVGAGVLATLGRSALLWWVYADERRARRVVAAEAAVAEGRGRTPLLERAGPVSGAIASALATTFLLAGVIESWWVAGLMVAVFAVLGLLRRGVLPPRMEAWRRVAARVPLLLRVALALLVAETLRRAFVDELDQRFTRLALYLLASTVVLHLLLPGRPSVDVSDEQSPPPPPPRGRDRRARAAALAVHPVRGRTPLTRRAAEVAVECELAGRVAGLRRDPEGAADFLDADGAAWVVEGGQGYDREVLMARFRNHVAAASGVLVDVQDLRPDQVADLRAAVEAEDLGERVRFP